MRTFRLRFSSRGLTKLIPVCSEVRSLNKGFEGDAWEVESVSTDCLQEKNSAIELSKKRGNRNCFIGNKSGLIQME